MVKVTRWWWIACRKAPRSKRGIDTTVDPAASAVFIRITKPSAWKGAAASTTSSSPMSSTASDCMTLATSAR
jgi:hypothetical protein